MAKYHVSELLVDTSHHNAHPSMRKPWFPSDAHAKQSFQKEITVAVTASTNSVTWS